MNTKVTGSQWHTDLYLQWDSHYSFAAKYSVINTLHHRAKAVSSNNQLLKEEEDHLQKVLTRNKYPLWALNRVKIKSKNSQRNISIEHIQMLTTGEQQGTRSHTWCMLPYVKGLSESIKNVGKKHGIQIYFKGGYTIKSLLMTPKDKDHITKKSSIIYRFKCKRVDCEDEYIGESSRTFGEGLRNTLRPPPQYMTIIPPQVMKPA